MSQKRHILLVEDIESTIDIVGRQLKALGFEVTVARNGLEALAKLAEQTPDLIVMDIQLPKIGGFEAVSRIRATPALGNIPILAATAKALKGDEARCLAAGCDGYIAKPFTHRQLETAINAVFKRRLDNLQQEER
jgi:two-component system cell cycle response regulator DivK